MKSEFFNFKWNITNWKIISLILFLTFIGVGINFLSSYHISLKLTGEPFYFVTKQSKILFVSLLLAFIVFIIPTKKIIQLAPWLFLTNFLFLLLVFVPGIGAKISGANRWINLIFIKFQPSEVMKVGFILFFAFFLNKKKDKLDNLKFGFTPAFLVLLLPVVIISIEPDFSSAVIFLCLGFLMLYATQVPIIYFFLSFVLSLPFFIYLIQSKRYFLSRFLFLNPEIDPYGRGYHIRQSLISFKKSGLIGMPSEQIIDSIKFFPDTHTDFTFSIIARVSGFLGVLIVVSAFLLLFYLGFQLSQRISDFCERMIVIGIICLFAIECFFHILVTIGLIPTTGILLPFLSYGGTALVTHFVLVGILLRISSENPPTVDQ